MSGIAGLWRLDGAPSLRADIHRMVRTLAHRGPDGVGSWSGPDTALAHLAMHTTPESLRERQPRVAATRGLALVADARIDNRADLISALGLGDQRPEPCDADLILEAYARWGDQCPTRLAGDFAFAIRDERRGAIFCARDRTGVKPFYYHRSPGAFAFSSEIKALLVLGDVPRDLDECWIADFLAGVREDRENTPYCAVRRLPAAHAASITADRMELRAYWELDPGRVHPRRSDEEYAEGYRELFFEAVRARLRRVGPPAAMLSGGLDSSAIVCAARELLRDDGTPVEAFSWTFDATPEADERPYIQAVLRQGGINPHFVDADSIPLVPHAEVFSGAFDAPPFAGNVGLNLGLYSDARASGVRVLLDGFYGDSAVHWGTERLAELMRRGRWIELARSIPRHARNANVPQALAFKAYLWWAFRREFLRPLVPGSVLRARQRKRAATQRAEDLVRPDFARRLRLGERHRRLRQLFTRPVRTARDAHFIELSAGFGVAALEMLDPAAAAYGIESRFPFTDHRLLEYCLALPSDQRFDEGWTRIIARRALAGVLPEEVRWRGGKASLRAWSLRALREASDALSKGPGPAEPYLDPAVLERARSRLGAPGDGTSSLFLWRAFSLARWLDLQTRPAGDPTEKGGGRHIGQIPATDVVVTYGPG